MKNVTIEYLGGSGFLVGLHERHFLFDADLPDQESEDYEQFREKLSDIEHLYIFSSHEIGDNYAQALYQLCGDKCTYIFHSDISFDKDCLIFSAGDTKTLDDMEITAYESTDAGIAYLIRTPELTFFHGGTLNLWHWRERSSIVQIEEAERRFSRIINTIPKNQIDISFFSIDPRQGSMYDAGAINFIMTVRPRILIPMCFENRPDIALRFSISGETQHTKVIAIDSPRKKMMISLPDTPQSSK